MKHQTLKRLIKAWKSMPAGHSFESKEQFLQIAGKLGDVRGDGSCWFFSRMSEHDPYGPNNIILIEIMTPEDWDYIIHPAL